MQRPQQGWMGRESVGRPSQKTASRGSCQSDMRGRLATACRECELFHKSLKVLKRTFRTLNCTCMLFYIIHADVTKRPLR
jgi:IS1 family transposase